MGKKHDQNVRYLAVALAHQQVAEDAIDRAERALTMLDVGASNNLSRAAAEQARAKVRELATELYVLERLVCS